jgi:hypothetical protein
MVTQVGYSVAGRLSGRVMPCAVETRSVCFLVEPQNQGQQFISGLTSKLFERCQNHWDGFSRFGLKTGDGFGFLDLASKSVVASGFLDWASKLVATVW